MASLRTCTTYQESRKLSCARLLVPQVSANILWSGLTVLLVTKSSEQIFCCCHEYWIHFGYHLLLSNVHTHPTLLEPLFFFFTMTMGDAYGDVDSLNTPISSILSTSFCNYSLMAYGKGYGLHLIGVSSVNFVLCSITLFSPGIFVNTSGYLLTKSFSARRWSSGKSSPNLTTQTPSPW